jgi:hypothetical protein
MNKLTPQTIKKEIQSLLKQINSNINVDNVTIDNIVLNYKPTAILKLDNI